MLSPFLICLTLITGALVQENQPQKKTEAAAVPAETVMVTGRVVYEDTGQPATHHRVQLIISTALLNARTLRIPTAITDEHGEFTLRGATAGEYYVYSEPVDNRGHSLLERVLTRSGDDDADAANLAQFKKINPRITVDGLRNLEVNLRVPNPHFGSISGMVFDAMHQPAPRATVHVVSKGGDLSGLSLRTDDQGRYKVRGLAKGEYTVSASPPAKEGESRNYQGSPGATYFPSTSLLKDSPPVAVLPDADTANVDVTLIARTLRSLAGTVRVRGDSQPVTNARLLLSARQITDPASDTSKAALAENPMSTYMSSTDKSGRWSFSNVPDGSYLLSVEPKQGEPVTPRFVQIEQELTVSGSDIEDLLIEVSEGARLSGSVVLESSGTQPQHISVDAIAYQPHAHSSVTVDETGKFVLTGVPTGEIEVSAFAVPRDKFYVKSIEANGLDLLRKKIPLAENNEIKDVRIVISANIGVITGRVLTSDKPVAGVNVMLRRTGDDKLRLLGGNLATVTNDRGVFTLSAAPGNYLVVAWRAADGPMALETAMSKAIKEQGTGLTLSPNDRKQLDIRLP